MSHLETTKANLKRLASDSLELALKELERLLSPESSLFNSFLLLKGQFKKCREEFLLGILSQEQSSQIYARLMSAFLQMAGDLSDSDLIPEKETAQKPAEKRGELLYHVPHTMQVMREEKCTVRIAWTEAALFENWKRQRNNIHRRNLRIAEIMGVELLSISEDAPFSIKSLHSTVQFLDEEEYTEWIFYVKPLRAGNYPLVIRISVIEMRNNREVKRELVLEEQINVSTDAPQEEADQEDMIRAPLAHFAAGAPFVEAPAFLTEVMRRYGALLVLVLVGVSSIFMPWRWGNDDIVVVPPIDKDSTKVDTNKLELNLFQPFQDVSLSFWMLDYRMDDTIKLEQELVQSPRVKQQKTRTINKRIAPDPSIVKDTDDINLPFVQSPRRFTFPSTDSSSHYTHSIKLDSVSALISRPVPPVVGLNPTFRFPFLDSVGLFPFPATGHWRLLQFSKDSIRPGFEERFIAKKREGNPFLIHPQKENKRY